MGGNCLFLYKKIKKSQRREIIMEETQSRKEANTVANTEALKAYVLAVNEMENPENVAENLYHQNRYAPLSEVIEKIKPVLKKHGLAFMQVPYIQYETLDDNGKARQVADISVTTKIVHVSGEMLEFPPMVMRSGNLNPQSIGSIITYCRRYSLASIFGLAGKEEDDDGNIAFEERESQHNQQYNQQFQSQKPESKPSSQPTLQTKQQPNNSTSTVESNKVRSKVVSKKEGTSGKGTPYIELVLESNGKQITAIAKDQKAYEQVLPLNEGEEATFGILSMQGFYFITTVDVEANANE